MTSVRGGRASCLILILFVLLALVFVPTFSGISGAVTRVEESHPSITYSGTWRAYSTTQSSGGSHVASNTVGSTASFAFNGTNVTLISFKHPNRGIARVYVDGVSETTVDLYSAEPLYQQAVYTKNGLVAGVHTVRIEITNNKNPASSGYYVAIDAFETDGTAYLPPPSVTGIDPTSGTVGTQVSISGKDFRNESGSVTFGGAEAIPRRYEESDQVTYDYFISWSSFSNAALSKGAAMRSNTGGSTAAFVFRDVPVTWVSMKSKDSGIAEVYVDDVFQATVDLYSDATEYQQPVYTYYKYDGATHVLKIKATGQKQTKATSSYVVVDAVETGGGGALPPHFWTDGNIVVKVPWNASSGDVMVTTEGGSVKAGTFTVSTPNISSLDPTSGDVETGVIITGNNFGAFQGKGYVIFNGISAAVSSWSNTKIAATVPTGATSGPVYVVQSGLQSNGVGFTVPVPAATTTPTTTTTPAAPSPTPVAGITAAGSGEIVGRVVNRAGQTIPGTAVRVNTTVMPTNPGGEFRFTLVAAGVYTVYYDAPGYRGQTQVIEVKSGQSTRCPTVIMDSGITPSTQGEIYGRVVSPAHQPIAGAVVRINSVVIPTNAAGEFRFQLVNPGVYTVYYDAAGYAGQTQVLEVKAGMVTYPPMVIMSGTLGEIYGRVLDAATRRPIPGTAVRVNSSVMPTNASGEFRFTLVHPGIYKVYYDAPGYKSQVQEVVAVFAGTTTICPTVLMSR